MGASLGFLGTFLTGNIWIGILLAALGGGALSLLLSYFTTTLKMDQFVIGLALFFVRAALSTLLYKIVIGITLTPPLIPSLEDIPIPFLSMIPIIGDALFNQNILVYFTIASVFILYYILYKTYAGLKLRAVGENPAADILGVNVFLTRHLCTTIGGMLMGMAGAYLPMVFTGAFTEGIVGGRGWIAIALTFVGGWTPHWILLGSILFAGVEVLAFRVQVIKVGIPYQMLLTIPYIFTILIMIIFRKRMMFPNFLGKNYDREKREI